MSEERSKKATCTIDEERESVSFHFDNEAKTVKTYKLDDFNETMQRKFSLHGMKQKLGDVYAGKFTPDQAVGLQEKLVDQILEGKWTAGRVGGGSVDSIGLLGQAIANVFATIGRAVPAAWQNLDTMTKEARAEIRAINEVAAELAILRAAKKKPGGSLADMLAKIG